MTFKEIEKYIKFGRKMGLKELKIGDFAVSFGEEPVKMSRKSAKEKLALDEIRTQAILDEMKIMDPVEYEEKLSLGEIEG